VKRTPFHLNHFHFEPGIYFRKKEDEVVGMVHIKLTKGLKVAGKNAISNTES